MGSGLMERGFHFLERAAKGDELSEYHLEAGIASLHCAALTYENSEWASILELYDMLYRLKPSPIVALNRAICVGESPGGRRRIGRIEEDSRSCQAQGLSLLSGSRGGISSFLRAGPAEAGKHFERAMKLARSRSETNLFERK